MTILNQRPTVPELLVVTGVGGWVLVGVALARGVRRVARRELAGREVGVRRGDALLQFLNLETALVLFAQFHDINSCELRHVRS
jgi:hypothetical protein